MTETKKPLKRPRGRAVLIEGRCIACGARCQSACPVNCIEMTETGEPIIDQPKCIGCIKCVKICPAEAIEMVFTPEEQKLLAELAGQSEAPEELDDEAATLAKKLAAYKGVWVFIEQTEGEAAKVSWELLGKGRELADTLTVELSAVLLGDQVENLCSEAFAYGADQAYLVDAPVLRH